MRGPRRRRGPARFFPEGFDADAAGAGGVEDERDLGFADERHALGAEGVKGGMGAGAAGGLDAHPGDVAGEVGRQARRACCAEDEGGQAEKGRS